MRDAFTKRENAPDSRKLPEALITGGLATHREPEGVHCVIYTRKEP
jgi:hypothetical protein